MKTKEWNDFVERYVHSEEMATKLKVAFDAEIKKAIAEHEAKAWKKYPENKPENENYLLITDGRVVSIGWYNYRTKDWWGDDSVMEYITAFRELPAPYREGGDK